MGKVSLDLQEDTFVKKYTETYDLSILIGVDRFSFLIVDPQQNVLMLRNYNFTEEDGLLASLEGSLKEIYINDEFVKAPFKKTQIGLMHPKNTLVPSDLFDATHQKIYLDNVVDFDTNDLLGSDGITPLNTVNVYATNSEIVNQIKGYFPSAKIMHGLSPVILGFKQITEHQSGRQICINIRERNVQLLLFENKELLFCNTFKYESSKDFIYYVMLLYDQFKLNPENDPIHIAGQIVEDSEIYHLLYRYVRHLNLVPAPSYYKYSSQYEALPQHFYFDLYSMKLCE